MKQAHRSSFAPLVGGSRLPRRSRRACPVELIVVAGTLASRRAWVGIAVLAAAGSALAATGLYFAFHHLGSFHHLVESPGQKLSGPCAHPGLATGNCLSLAIWDGGDIRRDGASAACAQTSPVGGRWNLPPAGSRRPLGKFLWQAHQVHLVCLSRPAVSWGSFNAWRIAVTHPTPHRERG